MAHPKTKAKVKVRLGDLIDQVRESALPGELPADSHFIGLEDIIPHEGVLGKVSQITSVKSRVSKFETGDVLYGRLRPYLRKSAIAEFNGSASAEFLVMRCSSRILSRYLLMILLSEDFSKYISNRVKGDRPRTSYDTVAGYQIDLPPIEVQTEICDRDEQLALAVARVEHAVDTHRNAASDLTNALRTRLIWKNCEVTTSLDQLLESIDYGTTQKSSYGGIGVPTLRIPNISPNGDIDTSDLKYTPIEKSDIEKYQLSDGDVLMIRSNGSLSLVGRAALVYELHATYAFAGYLLRLRPKQGVLGGYLLQLVKSGPFLKMVEKAARSSTGINNLSAARLKKFSVPLASIEKQKTIVDTLEKLQAEVFLSSEYLEKAKFNAKALREKIRDVWLGNSASHSVLAQSSRPTKADNLEDLTLQMDWDSIDDIESSILEHIDLMEPQGVGFEVLSSKMRVEYESLRDAVFKLLTGNPKMLSQEFDKQSRSIVLRRAK